MKLLFILISLVSVVLQSCSVSQNEFHVSPSGNDSNEGTEKEPLRSISAAANMAQPGDVITVHEGIYRERVNPLNGGTSDSNRIVYQAAAGENVIIKGSEVIKDWKHLSGDTWEVTLPNNFFGSFNPYKDVINGDWFNPLDRVHHTGAVYLNGHWLTEAAAIDSVHKPAWHDSILVCRSRFI